jgi:tRNA G18 (ribose-2'-O)-methylase SpoU
VPDPPPAAPGTGRVPERVDDLDDERLAGYRGLRGGRRLDRAEQRLGVFVAEGLHALEQLVASRYPAVSILAAEDRRAQVGPLAEAAGVPCYLAAPRLLEEIAGFNVHRGVLALGRRLPDEDPAGLLAGLPAAAPVVVTEGLNDHENLGALFRNAAALGAAAVLGDPATCDPLYRRCVRVSSGHALRVPWTRLAPWPDALAVVRSSGRRVLALTPDPAAPAITSAVGAGGGAGRALAGGPVPVAILVGAEGPGLSDAAMAAADALVRIPLAGGVDSLNVATAAAIALHRLGPPLA